MNERHCLASRLQRGQAARQLPANATDEVRRVTSPARCRYSLVHLNSHQDQLICNVELARFKWRGGREKARVAMFSLTNGARQLTKVANNATSSAGVEHVPHAPHRVDVRRLSVTQ